MVFGGATVDILAPLIADRAAAQDPGKTEVSSEPFDLTALGCWEVMTLTEDDSTFVMAMLIGYAKGQESAPQATLRGIFETVESLDAACTENPDQSVLDILT